MNSNAATGTTTLAALLARGRDGESWDGALDLSLVRQAKGHDVGPLVYRALHRSGAWARQPDEVRQALTQIAGETALLDQLRLGHDRRVIAALAAAGVSPLLFKGAALAHRHYPESWLRPRVDTDLLIRASERNAAASVLERLGYGRAERPTGDHVTHQFTYVRATPAGRIEYDVHWKIADPQVFADVLTVDEAAQRSVPMPVLGDAARAISDVDALVVACTHRVAHHFDTNCLLYLYDIDLLARRLGDADWDRVAAIAAQKRVRRVCARGLTLAAGLLATPAPARVSRAMAVDESEPSASYLAPELRRVDILRSDLLALGWRARVRLLREHLLPPPEYVLRSYGTRHTALLPALYVHRIVRGAFKWVRPLKERGS
ncbi:MAG TPA: nucleotidyltransferase family protein [Vicinamibacterales bacterium]|nr:nucleotidyltransferase family protein [Vicinamibacterales bacterium]